MNSFTFWKINLNLNLLTLWLHLSKLLYCIVLKVNTYSFCQIKKFFFFIPQILVRNGVNYNWALFCSRDVYWTDHPLNLILIKVVFLFQSFLVLAEDMCIVYTMYLIMQVYFNLFLKYLFFWWNVLFLNCRQILLHL